MRLLPTRGDHASHTHIPAKPAPDADQVISKMDDVICRCGTYPHIKKGIKTAIQIMKKEGKI